jgi:hypothetical protein
MAITINGSGTITGISAGGLPDGSVTAADIESSLDLSGKTVTLPAGTGGKVLQVVQTTSSGDISSTATSDTASGLIVSLTPSSSSSKVLVMLQGGLIFPTVAGGMECRTSIYRKEGAGGTYTSLGRFQNTYYYGYGPESGFHIAYLDSPSATDTLYYQIYMSSNFTDTWYLNYGSSFGTTITFIAMEIAG